MSYGSILDTDTFSAADIKNLIEGIFSSTYPLTWTAFTPTWGAGGSMTFTGVTNIKTQRVQCGKKVDYFVEARGTQGGSASDSITFTPGVTIANGVASVVGLSYVWRSGVWSFIGLAQVVSSTTIKLSKYDYTNFPAPAGSDDCRVFSIGTFEAA